MSILLVFGSTSGNTEMVCERVAKILKNSGQKVELKRAEHMTPQMLTGFDAYVFAASTYGHGMLQDHFIPLAKALEKEDFTGKKFAVIGLGDSKYDAEYNIESATILEELVKRRRGDLLLPALRINKTPLRQLSGKVIQWAEELANCFVDLK